ncbi:Gag-Pol polyprotein [Gossypium australe]|uniref:Gag-Pol polyprotein n=1 Tax=Gossypium australe TaxID=47621 RepID=A0A5B6V906_9ROSI|nr:Gag-Pol polyprotein [Gossypium australe]
MCRIIVKRFGLSVVEYSSFCCAKRKCYMGYISKRFLDQKKKEFLELKQGNMTVSKYERKFVRLSKYAREYVLTEVAMEFVVLADRAHKAEELSKEKRKSQASASKTSKKYHDHFTTFTGYSGKERGFQHSNQRSSSPTITSTSKLSNPASRGRPPRHPGNVSGSRSATKDSTVKSEVRTPAKTYAIRAREDASAPDVITCTFSLLDIDINALIDLGSTHSYLCTNLISVKNLSVESTNFVVKVSNPLVCDGR